MVDNLEPTSNVTKQPSDNLTKHLVLGTKLLLVGILAVIIVTIDRSKNDVRAYVESHGCLEVLAPRASRTTIKYLCEVGPTSSLKLLTPQDIRELDAASKQLSQKRSH